MAYIGIECAVIWKIDMELIIIPNVTVCVRACVCLGALCINFDQFSIPFCVFVNLLSILGGLSISRSVIHFATLFCECGLQLFTDNRSKLRLTALLSNFHHELSLSRNCQKHVPNRLICQMFECENLRSNSILQTHLVVWVLPFCEHHIFKLFALFFRMSL